MVKVKTKTCIIVGYITPWKGGHPNAHTYKHKCVHVCSKCTNIYNGHWFYVAMFFTGHTLAFSLLFLFVSTQKDVKDAKLLLFVYVSN